MIDNPITPISSSAHSLPAVRMSCALPSWPVAVPHQGEIQALANTNLVPVSALKKDDSAKITTINTVFQWTTAEIGALATAIFSEGTTAQDAGKISQYRNHLQNIEQQLGSIDLTAAHQKDAKVLLAKAHSALDRLEILSRELPSYYEREECLDERIDRLVWGEKDATERRNPLLALQSLDRTLEQYHQLAKKVDSSSPLTDFLDQSREGLEFNLCEWADDLEEAANDEYQRLVAWLDDDPDNGDAQQLLGALKQQLLTIKDELATASEDAAALGLAKSSKSLLQAGDAVAKLSTAITQRNADLTYGSEEWQSLMQRCPKPPVGLFQRVITQLDPEHWSARTKSAVHSIFIGMQLSQQAIEIYQRLPQADQQSQEQEAIEKVPEKVRKKIEREAGVLRNYLSSDRYDQLIEPGRLEEFTKGHPTLRAVLESTIAQYGKVPPSNQELLDIVNQFRTQQLLTASSASGTTATHQSKDTEEADSTSKVAPALIRNIGSWSELFEEGALAEQSHESFVQHTRMDTRQEIAAALTTAKTMRAELATTTTPGIAELRDSVNLLRRELLKSANEAPSDTCPLIELALWKQRVEDQCFALETLEKVIQKQMVEVRDAITGDVSAHEAGGAKHLNTVKLHRLVKALGIPGVDVPLPAAVESDRVHAFLNATAPAAYRHWQALEAEKKRYQGAQPFFRSEVAAPYLAAIQQAITTAYQQPDAFEKLAPSAEVRALIQEVKDAGDFLMARSTGEEDSRELSSAGANESVAYVAPEEQEICQALAVVIGSYFSPDSLQTRDDAGQDVFAGELKLAVTLQRLIGERVGGATNPAEIPVSMVIFSNELIYVGDEEFRALKGSAVYGHGDGVVKGKGIASDSFLVLQSVAHPDEIEIFYSNVDKSERLAPVKGTEGPAELAKVANPPELRHKPALSNEMIRRIFHFAVVSEKYFGYPGADNEMVVKKGIIHPVQIRAETSDTMTPTYLDMRQVAKGPDSPIIDTLQATLINAGPASHMTIDNADHVLHARTLANARENFDISRHKLVIFNEPEPDLSHDIVHFRDLFIPCLLARDSSSVDDIVSKVGAEQPLSICVQTATLRLWDSDKGDIGSYVSEGFTVHPANLGISLPTMLPGPSTKATRGVPEEVQDLLVATRNATTKEEALHHLQELNSNPWMRHVHKRCSAAADKLASGKPLHPEIAKRYQALANFGKQLSRALEEAEATITQMKGNEQLRPLLRAKIVELLIAGRKDKGSAIGEFSATDILGVDEDIRTLEEYQSALPHKPHLLDLVLVGGKATSPEGAAKWLEFLKGLEPLIEDGSVTKEQVTQLRTLMTALQQTDALPYWLAFQFPKVGAPSSATLDTILKTLPASDMPFVEQQLAAKPRLQALRHRLSDFSTPDTFEDAFQTLLELASPEKQEEIAEQMRRTPTAQVIALNTLQELVDVYDTAIKTMLASQEWKGEAKTVIYKRMLQGYMQLLVSWHTGLAIGETHAVRWKGALDILPTNNMKLLNARPDFSAELTSILSVPTVLRYPQQYEEYFTSIHQNLIDITRVKLTKLISSDDIAHSTLPVSVKEAVDKISKKQVTDFERIPQLVGLEVSDEAIVMRYNIPLSVHSAKLTLTYDKGSQKLVLNGQFFDMLGRTKPIATYAEALHVEGECPMAKPIQLKEGQELSITWSIADEQQLDKILELFSGLCRYTFSAGGPLEKKITNAMFNSYEYRALTKIQEATRKMSTPEKALASLPTVLDLSRSEKAMRLALPLISEIASSAPSLETRDRALELMAGICTHGIAVEEAERLVTDAIASRGRSDPSSGVLRLLAAILQQGHGSDMAEAYVRETLADAMNSDNSDYLDAFRDVVAALMADGRAVDIAESFAPKLLPDIKSAANQLAFYNDRKFARMTRYIESLVKAGKGYDIAAEFIRQTPIAASHQRFTIWEALALQGQGEELWTELMKDGSLAPLYLIGGIYAKHGRYEAAINILEATSKQSNLLWGQARNQLVEELTKRGNGPRLWDINPFLVKDVYRKLVHSATSDSRAALLAEIGALAQRDSQGLAFALDTAKEEIEKNNISAELIQLLRSIGIDAQTYALAEQAARQATQNSFSPLFNTGLELIDTLIQQGQGYRIIDDIRSSLPSEHPATAKVAELYAKLPWFWSWR